MSYSAKCRALFIIEYLIEFRKRCFYDLGIEFEFSGGSYFAPVSVNSFNTTAYKFLLGQVRFTRLAISTVKEILRLFVLNFFWRTELVLLSCIEDQNSDFENIVVTWGKAADFSDGPDFFRDRYFGDYFKDKKTIKIILMTDFSSPIIKSGFAIVCRKKKCFPCFIFLKTALTNLLIHLRSCKSVSFNGWREKLVFYLLGLSYFSPRFNHSLALSEKLANFFRGFKIKESVNTGWVAYEAQPEQCAAIHSLKAQFPEITFRGYIHSTLGILPVHMLKPFFGSPDQLLVHGLAYEDVLRKLGWNKTPVFVETSLRYTRNSQELIPAGTVVFPYSRDNFEYPFELIKLLVKTGKVRLKVLRPHPIAGITERVRVKYSKLIDDYCSLSGPRGIIIIGNTSVPLEQLERGNKEELLHVPSSCSVFENFDNGLWDRYLDFEDFGGIVKMSLKQAGAFILFD